MKTLYFYGFKKEKLRAQLPNKINKIPREELIDFWNSNKTKKMDRDLFEIKANMTLIKFVILHFS